MSKLELLTISGILAISLLIMGFAYLRSVRRWARRLRKASQRNRRLIKAARERNRAVENLSESRHFLDTIFDNIPTMIFVKDAKTLKFVKMNKAGYDLIGVLPSQLIGKTDRDFFPAEQVEHFISHDLRVLTSGRSSEIHEEPIATPVGVRYLYTKKIPLFDKWGEPTYLLGISEDITERKEAENQRLMLSREAAARNEAEKNTLRMKLLAKTAEALSSSLDVHQMLNEFSQVVVQSYCPWLLTDYYDFLDSSVQRTTSLYHCGQDGQKPPHQVSRPVKDFPFSDAADEIMKRQEGRFFSKVDRSLLRLFISDQEQIEKIMNTNPLCLVAMPISCGDRKYGIFVYISTPHDMPCGDLELSMAQDLSKRASLAIDNARLFARANDANRAKSAFLANMSHEIRTPLGVIMGFADLMTDDHVTPAQIKEGATRIKNNGSMLLKVVDEILDLSKIESEQLHLENQKFSLKQVVDDIYHLFEYRAQAKGLKFWIGPIPELDFQLYSDPLRIKQILINIVGNAIKFTETGFVRVNVELDHLSREGSDGELRFTVADSGIGVASDKVDKIFQPFVQGDSSMTRLFGGTGLGLFLARRLARLMGGDVRLKTDASIKGCEFEVRLRVQRGDALPAQASDASAGGEKTAACPGPARPLRALIVDDADDNRLLLSSYLKRLNWDYDVAVDGFEALQKVDEGQFEVVLMDIQMPLMDGFEALKKLRLRNFNRPVIAVTAHAMKGDREQCILAGFDDYLSKPVSRSALQQVLERQEMKDQFSEVSVSL